METYVSEVDKEQQPAPNSLGENQRQRPVDEPKAGAPKRKLRFLIFGALVAALVVGGGFYLHSRNRVSTDDAQVDGRIVPIASRISGTVATVLATDNQQVKAGDVLVRIDPRDDQVRVDQARAALALAESQQRGAQATVPMTSETTQSGTSSAQAQLLGAQAELAKARANAQQTAGSGQAYAQANVEAAQANYNRASADLERMKPLAAKSEISQQQYDAYVGAARVAEGQLKAAQQSLVGAHDKAEADRAAVLSAQAQVQEAAAGVAQSQANRRQVQVSASQAQSAAAMVGQARANLAAAELQLSYTTITAPMDGIVTKKTVQVGQTVQPGQAFMTLVPLSDVWITANFKETQLKDVRTGQRVDVHVDMYGRSFSGRVDSISGATGSRLSLLPAENATGNYVKVVQRIPVKIVLDPLPAGFVLRPGMNVGATIFTR